MKVVEIFNSIEGEGLRAGMPCTFIRLQGCNLNCSYCDSKYAWDSTSSYCEMSVAEIVDTVSEWKCPLVTITGGEPLIHPGIYTLIQQLVNLGYNVNVETNGSVVPNGTGKNIFYTMDYKTLSSGMNDRMNKEAFKLLRSRDVIKCVVGSKEDLDDCLHFLEDFNPTAYIFVSPIFGKIEAKAIVEYIQTHKLWNWRVQLQLHKYIWDKDERGV